MSRPLPLRVPIVAGEPADSLLQRLAYRWQLSRAEFQRLIGVSEAERRQGRHVEKLASLADHDVADLAAVTPCREANSRAVFLCKAWTDVADTAIAGTRFCPKCLAHDRETMDVPARTHLAAWARPEWLSKAVATCPLHCCLLLSECGACGRQAGPENFAIDVCRCGALLSASVSVEFASAVDEALCRLIHTGEASGSFVGAGLHHIASFLTKLGTATLGWHKHRPELAGLEELRIREAGFALLASGPESLSNVVDQVLAGALPGRSGKLGLVSAYGWLWSGWLGVPGPNPLDATLRERLREHAVSRGILAPDEEGGINLAGARAILGCGHHRARRLLQARGLFSGSELPGRAMVLDGDRVRALARERSRLVKSREAAAQLGISRLRLRELVRAGLIRPAKGRGQGAQEQRFYPRAIVRFVTELARAGSTSDEGSCCTSLPIACRNRSVPLVAAVSAIRSGRLRVRRDQSQPGIAGLLVREVDLAAVQVERRRATITEAHRELGVHYEAARWLAAHGQIGPVEGSVDRAGIAKFKSTYGTAKELGEPFGLSGRAISLQFASHGLRPAFGPPACRQAFWRRSEAGRVLRHVA